MRRYQRRFVAAGVMWLLALQAAVALSILAYEAGPLGPDEAITDAIQELPDWFEPIAVGVRAITTTQFVLVAGTAAAVALWFAGWRAEAVTLVAMLAVLPFLQSGIKDIVDRPRPDPALVDQKTGFGSESFPSGHVMSGTILYGYLLGLAWLRRERAWAIAAAAALALVLLLNAVANVYMGVHWPTDVAGGVLWALVLLIPAFALLPLTQRTFASSGAEYPERSL